MCQQLQLHVNNKSFHCNRNNNYNTNVCLHFNNNCNINKYNSTYVNDFNYTLTYPSSTTIANAKTIYKLKQHQYQHHPVNSNCNNNLCLHFNNSDFRCMWTNFNIYNNNYKTKTYNNDRWIQQTTSTSTCQQQFMYQLHDNLFTTTTTTTINATNNISLSTAICRNPTYTSIKPTPTTTTQNNICN